MARVAPAEFLRWDGLEHGEPPAGCQCPPDARHCPADHHVGGCKREGCPCTATTRPPGAVEIDRELTLADGAIVRVVFESHWLGGGYFDDPLAPHPHTDLHGDVSSTGYRSHFGAMGETPESVGFADWDGYLLALAEHHHDLYLRETKRRAGPRPTDHDVAATPTRAMRKQALAATQLTLFG